MFLLSNPVAPQNLVAAPGTHLYTAVEGGKMLGSLSLVVFSIPTGTKVRFCKTRNSQFVKSSYVPNYARPGSKTWWSTATRVAKG